MSNDESTSELGSGPSRGTNFAKEIAVFRPFRLAPMLAVVSKVVSRCLKWWGRFAAPCCALIRSSPSEMPGQGHCGAAGRLRGIPPCQHTGRLAKARHSPRAVLWQLPRRVLVEKVRLRSGGASGLDQPCQEARLAEAQAAQGSHRPCVRRTDAAGQLPGRV